MSDLARVAARVWYGDGLAASAARAALWPAASLFGAVVRARSLLYDAGVLASTPLALPAVGVGNLTVGGTGKTPVAAWLARRLRECGASPAVVLRGYGDDEPGVHAALNPDVRVLVDADRVRGTEEAARRGADVVVLDDAFQHRRARRELDTVLVSAEHATRRARMLPAGPYREPLTALRRASVIVVTRKSSSVAEAEEVRVRLERIAPHVPTAVISLQLDQLHAWGPDVRVAPLGALAGERVVAAAGIGDPSAFFRQLEAAGADVDAVALSDHHRYTEGDVASLAERAARVDRFVCTLKDAVKLGPLWPHFAPPLWYVSQRVVVERGADVLEDLVATLLRARHTETTGPGRAS